jgi:hypothetical protein
LPFLPPAIGGLVDQVRMTPATRAVEWNSPKSVFPSAQPGSEYHEGLWSGEESGNAHLGYC